MNEINDGGPAFPMAANEYAGNGPCWGMTLRDYFAGKALNAFLTWSHAYDMEPDEHAKAAYEIADAMLRARGAA